MLSNHSSPAEVVRSFVAYSFLELWFLEQRSLFQAPREMREGECDETKTRGEWGREKEGGKEEEPVIIFLNTSCRYTSSRYTL